MEPSENKISELHKLFTRLRRGNLNRETDLIAAQNNAIRTNYVRAKIGKTQGKSKCRLRGERLSSKPHEKRMQQTDREVQEQTRLDGEGDLRDCSIIKIWPYRHMIFTQPESSMENKTHKVHCNFEIKTDHPI